MNYKELQAKKAERYIPFTDSERYAITKIIKEKTGDAELCIRISLQLQEYARLIETEKQYILVKNKPISQLLREAADYLS